MTTTSKHAALLFLALLLATAGCATHKPMSADELDSAVVEGFSQSGSVTAPDRWWKAFGNTELELLIEEALSDNLDLQQAWARLRQAQALYRITDSNRFPQVDAGASASRTRNSEGQQKTSDSLSLSASASYEVDLWGKISAASRADWLSYSATRKDIEATALELTSTIAQTWLSIVEQELTLALLNEQLQVNGEYLRLVELRFAQGEASAVEVFQQRLQQASTQGRIPASEANLKVLHNRLAVLLGKTPGSVETSETESLPEVPELPDTGIPADVLGKRPDVRAAELSLLSADQDLAVTKGDLYPTLSLSASAGGNSTDFSEGIENWFGNLTTNLLAPIFDHGSRKANVERNEAVVEEKLLSWKQLLLTAVQDVEDALANEDGQRRTLAEIRNQIELAEKTLERARRSYVNGLSTYLDVLTSLQSLQGLQLEEISARKQLLVYRIDLYLALGGDWTSELSSSVALGGEPQ